MATATATAPAKKATAKKATTPAASGQGNANAIAAHLAPLLSGVGKGATGWQVNPAATYTPKPTKGTGPTVPYNSNAKNNIVSWQLLGYLTHTTPLPTAVLQAILAAQPTNHKCFVGYTQKHMVQAKLTKAPNGPAIAIALAGAGYYIHTNSKGNTVLWHNNIAKPA